MKSLKILIKNHKRKKRMRIKFKRKKLRWMKLKKLRWMKLKKNPKTLNNS
jgi:hypothetical protein